MITSINQRETAVVLGTLTAAGYYESKKGYKVFRYMLDGTPENIALYHKTVYTSKGYNIPELRAEEAETEEGLERALYMSKTEIPSGTTILLSTTDRIYPQLQF